MTVYTPGTSAAYSLFALRLTLVGTQAALSLSCLSGMF